MKILHVNLIVLMCFFNPYVISYSFAQDLTPENINLAPRTFCLNTNGTVTETGIRHIYICCYSNKKKCLISDEKKSYSRLIAITQTDYHHIK